MLVLFAGGLLTACGAAPRSVTPQPPEVLPAASQTPFLPPPDPTASPTPRCIAAQGTWTDAEYPGVAVAGTVPVRIYLPPCASEPGARYPVAYFLHGKPYTETQWIDLGIEALVEGEAVPMIIVLARQPEPIFSGSDGGPGSYETEFLDGLVPWVDQMYPSDPNPARRAVVGLSRGGVWALEVGMTHPEAIGTVVALSPALAVNYARPSYDPLRLAEAAPALPSRILLMVGDTDWARTKTEDLARRLADRGAESELRIVPGAHVDPTWGSMLPDVLAYLSAGWR